MNKPRGFGMGPRPIISAWVHQHRQAAADSLAKMALEPLSTLLTWLVVGVVLALPTTLLVALLNAEQLAAGLQQPAQFSLLLEDDVSEQQVRVLRDNIAARAGIAQAEVISKDEALAQFSLDTGLDTVLASLESNPLPNTILVRPAGGGDSRRYGSLADSLGRMSGVAQVVMDTRWIERLQALLALSYRLVWGFGVMMSVGAILILANTLRLAIEARREEIIVIKLIGGSDGFARRPFLYSGLWFGIGGGGAAVILVWALLYFISPPLMGLLQLYDSPEQLQGLSLVGVLQLILIGGLLGLLSAWQATLLHLRRAEPQ